MSTVCFKVFDGDRDGRLSEAEVRLMVDTLHAMSAEVSEAGKYAMNSPPFLLCSPLKSRRVIR